MNRGKSKLSRRDFTKLSAMGLGTLPLMGFDQAFRGSASRTTGDIEVYIFSKHLQFLGYGEMAEATAEMGFNGLDLTVRPEGHVLPENVRDDLPKAVEAMQKFGLLPRLMTMNVLDTGDSEQVNVLETAGKLGFIHYRTGSLTYPEDRTIPESRTSMDSNSKIWKSLTKPLVLSDVTKTILANV